MTTAASQLDEIHRHDGGRLIATLVRLIGDFTLAEEALQDAYATALQQWPLNGMPASPQAWLISTARHKALDTLRRQRRFASKTAELAHAAAERSLVEFSDPADDAHIPDDRLRLIFTCCHPALSVDAQVALTLRSLCSLTTEEIARAFLVPVATMAQRLVRAQRKIRDAHIPYRVPDPDELPARITAVHGVVYLVFTEGYAATTGPALERPDLATEAIRLGRALTELLPNDSESEALLSLMLLHHARRDARLDEHGEMVLLEDQDRSRWHATSLTEGIERARHALKIRATPFPGPYSLQAAIAAVHGEATRSDQTDWRQIAALYGVLLRIQPTPVVELNRAVAVAMADGPEHGLRIIERLETSGALPGYHLLPASKGALLERLGRTSEALTAYEDALTLVQNDAERRLLEKKKARLTPGTTS